MARDTSTNSLKQFGSAKPIHFPSAAHGHDDGASGTGPTNFSMPLGLSPPISDFVDEVRTSSKKGHYIPLNASAASGSTLRSRTASPVSFGYPYGRSMHGGLFAESHTPTAILG